MRFKVTPINLVDLETGEVVSIREINTSELSEKEIVELLISMKEFQTEVRERVFGVEAEFLRRMEDKGASKYEDESVKVTIQKKFDYEYDTNTIESLKEYVTDAQFGQTFEKQYKVNRTFLKSLTTLGGKVKELVEKATTMIPQKPYVKIERKEKKVG